MSVAIVCMTEGHSGVTFNTSDIGSQENLTGSIANEVSFYLITICLLNSHARVCFAYKTNINSRYYILCGFSK
jgi:hypothetical protein